MIFESNRRIAVPQIRLRGSRVFGFATKNGTRYDARACCENVDVVRDVKPFDEWVKTKIRVEKPDPGAVATFRNDEILYFKRKVRITMKSGDGASLLPYARQEKRKGRFNKNTDLVFIGHLEGHGVEVRYTLNGKDPSRTKYQIYKGEFNIKTGTASNSLISLKARTYERGKWSDVILVQFKIFSNYANMSDGLVIEA